MFLAAGLFAASRITVIWQLYVFFGVLIALGVNSLSFTPHMSLIPRWFIRKRGLANGLVLAGIGTGIMVLAPFAQVMIDTMGWRSAFLVLGAVVFFGVVPATAIFHRGSPVEVGQYPDGKSPNPDRTLSQRKLSPDTDGPSLVVVHRWSLRMATRARAFWFMGVASITYGFMMNILVVHLAAHVVDMGYRPVLAASLLGTMGLLASIGGIMGGSLSDRLGREIGYTIGGTAAFIGVLHLLFVRDTSTPWMLWLFVILFGLGQGTMSPISAAKVGDLFPGASLGKIFGILSTCFGVGGALGAYAGGYLYDITGSYSIPFVLVLMSICLGVAGIWLASAPLPKTPRGLAARGPD
jgi:MFS family permease